MMRSLQSNTSCCIFHQSFKVNIFDIWIHKPRGSLFKEFSVLEIWTNFCSIQTRKPLYNHRQVFSSGRLVDVFNWCWVAFEVLVRSIPLIRGSEQSLLCISTMLISSRLPRPALNLLLSPASPSEIKISFMLHLHNRPPLLPHLSPKWGLKLMR